MLSVKETDILECMIEFCKRIEEKMASVSSKEAFEKDKDLNDIVCFNVMQIGELAGKLSKEFIKNYNQQPWGDIVGMRNIIVHGYWSIEEKEVWQCASTEIKPLREYCEFILQENK